MARRRTICALELICAAAILAASGVAAARPSMVASAIVADPVDLPDTPAARVAKGFLAMVNDGTEKAVVSFEGTYASASRRGSVEISERVRRVAALHEQWGTVTIERIVESTDTNIHLSVRGDRAGAMQMNFQMSKAEPGKFDAVMIESGDRPMTRPAPITAEQVAKVAERACQTLEEGYVYPEIAKKMTESVLAKVKNGDYASVADEAQLAMRLTEDFREISKDGHLWVRFAPESAGNSAPQLGDGGDVMRRENYGFRRVELLPGNIGYLRFDFFAGEEEARPTATSAMSFMANADAVIFDMRYNGGGSPAMVQFITSYLFDKPTHLNDMIDRQGNTVESFWTLDEIPGNRINADTPVFVLTSERTFSGAEEFSYNLKNLKRATIIGETTGGGAHPVRGERLNERFVMGVPYMRANNPISKTNWEGTGVEPDIKTTATEALDRALAEARTAIEKSRAASQPSK